MDELTEHQKHLRGVVRSAQDECHARRLAEIDAATAYMRELGKGGDARHKEADWRYAEARYEVGAWALESARTDLIACNNLILDMLEGRTHGDN